MKIVDVSSTATVDRLFGEARRRKSYIPFGSLFQVRTLGLNPEKPYAIFLEDGEENVKMFLLYFHGDVWKTKPVKEGVRTMHNLSQIISNEEVGTTTTRTDFNVFDIIDVEVQKIAA